MKGNPSKDKDILLSLKRILVGPAKAVNSLARLLGDRTQMGGLGTQSSFFSSNMTLMPAAIESSCKADLRGSISL
jgi:hypothetical protein